MLVDAPRIQKNLYHAIGLFYFDRCRQELGSKYSAILLLLREYLTSDRIAISEHVVSHFHVLPRPAHVSVLLQLDNNIIGNQI